MAHILSIETSTTVCSVALHRDGELLAIREDSRPNSHAVNITLFAEAVAKEAGISLQNIDAIAVSKGPGSYTGLRIGVSAAKGLCYGLDKPLIAINTLEGMALNEQLNAHITPSALLCPMIDARRMEVYCALFDSQRSLVEETKAVIVDESSFSMHLDTHKVIFFGDGAAKCRPVLTHPNAVFVDGITPSARLTGKLAYEYYQQSRFEDVAYFEPFYLKEFVGTVTKKH